MRRYLSSFIVAFLFLSSCTKNKTGSNCTACTSAISFKTDILPIFEVSCALSGCHDTITHAAAVILDSANAYTKVTEHGTGYVTPGNANASLLYTTLNTPNTSSVNGMPKGLAPLSECQIEAIACWINQGALNN